MRSHLFCFGYGYCARHLAATLRAGAADFEVSGTTRTEERRAQLEGDGDRVRLFDGERPLVGAEEVLAEATHLLISIAPDDLGDSTLRLHREALAGARRLRWIGYLSTTGVYGDTGGGWVDEETEPRPEHERGRARRAAEAEWLEFGREASIPVRVFRLAGIYGPGPGRNALSRLRAGTARRVVKPGMVFNRIHVDDIVATLRASMAGAVGPEVVQGAVYNVADDRPLPPEDAIVCAARLLGVEPPPEVPFDDPALPPFVRSFYVGCTRVRNQKIKSELGVTLRYPDVVAGLTGLAALGEGR
jgi:nucleoside-diphosphate-sugar epimerase